MACALGPGGCGAFLIKPGVLVTYVQTPFPLSGCGVVCGLRHGIRYGS